MQGKEAVVFRGDRHGLSLQIDEEAPFGDVVEQLREKLASGADFFRGAEVRIDTGERLTDEVETRLLQELIRAHGMTLTDKGSGETAPARTPRRASDGSRHGLSPGGRGGSTVGRDVGLEPCLLVERTLRSGQRVEFDGSVVVLGDVNPGADVVATGSVVVMGALRGMVHAGAAGDVEARVVALRLHPTQLRIAHHITRPPDGEPQYADGPEEARIRGEHIQIERYEP